ncbi:MAG: glycosyltransferase, partial [Candidatus Hydrogenedentota bacterium]
MEFERREVARAIRESYEAVTSVDGKDGKKGLRIFFLALTVDVGVYQGDSTHVIELVSNLREMGHNVRWIARQSSSRESRPDPFFHRVSRKRKARSELMRLFQLLLSMARGVYHIIRHIRGSDLVYSRDRFSLLLALLPSKLSHKPIVYEVNGLTSEQRKMHGDYLMNRLYVWLLETLDKVAFRNAARAVCVTEAIRSFYSEHQPKYAGKFLTVNNGVNTRLFHPLPTDEYVAELRKRLGFEERDEVVAYVGNLSLWQGVEYLVRSAPAVAEKNSAARFMVVGH